MIIFLKNYTKKNLKKKRDMVRKTFSFNKVSIKNKLIGQTSGQLG